MSLLAPPHEIVGAWDASASVRDRIRALGPVLVDEGPLVVVGDATVARTPAGTVCVLAGSIDAWAARRASIPTTDDGHDGALRLAAAFESEGVAALDRARGAWSAALWSPARGDAVLARDAFGARSMHWRRADGGTLFGEDVRDVLAASITTPRPRPDAIARWIADAQFTGSATLLDGVFRLPAGEWVDLTRATEPIKYYVLRCPGRRELLWGLDEAADCTRAAVDAAVERAAPAAGERIGLLLSGGLDSSTIASTAVERLGAARVHAISVVFPEHEDADEAQLIRQTVEQLGVTADALPVRVTSALPRWLEAVQTWKIPPSFGLGFVYTPMIERAAELGLTRVITGQGGDEVFFNDPYLYLTDLMRRGRFVRAWQLAGRSPIAPPNPRARVKVLSHMLGFLRSDFAQQASVSGPDDALQLIGPSLAAGVQEARRDGHWTAYDVDGPLCWRERLHTITRFREDADVAGGLRRQARSLGVEERHPLLHDRDLIEACARIAPAPVFDRRYDRAVARHALRGRVPDAIVDRPAKSHFTDLVTEALRGPDRHQLNDLLAPGAEVRGYLADGVVEQRLTAPDAPDRHPAGVYGWMYEITRTAGVELWLKELAR